MSLIADIIAKVVAAFLAFVAGERQRRDNDAAREALGAAKASAKGAQEAAERVAQANLTEAGADALHASDKTDDAFDREFERRG